MMRDQRRTAVGTRREKVHDGGWGEMEMERCRRVGVMVVGWNGCSSECGFVRNVAYM